MYFPQNSNHAGRLTLLFIIGLLCPSDSFAGEQERLVFTYHTDRGVDAEIYLAYSNDGLPDYYYCDLHTPICLEDLCNPIELRLEWDLLGNFRNYREVPGKEITKFDHEPFEKEDHQQLKRILADKESLLQDYRMEDLVDTTRKVYSAEIDGLTAATNTTFADKLVPGAIYTCYTLWHLVNGEIAGRVNSHTAELLTRELKKKMLLSGRTVYEDFILDGMDQEERIGFSPELFTLIDSKNRYIAVKSIRNLPESGLVKASLLELVARFKAYSFPVQTAIIHYFMRQPCDPDLLQAWVAVTDVAREKHKPNLYKLLEAGLDCMNGKSVASLTRLLEERPQSHDSHDKRLLMFLKNK